MKRTKFYEKESKINKLNLFIIGFGILAIVATGFLYLSKLQQETLTRTVEDYAVAVE